MRHSFVGLTFSLAILAATPGLPVAQSASQAPALMADQFDVSPDFRDFKNSYYVADSLSSLTPGTASGTIK